MPTAGEPHGTGKSAWNSPVRAHTRVRARTGAGRLAFLGETLGAWQEGMAGLRLLGWQDQLLVPFIHSTNRKPAERRAPRERRQEDRSKQNRRRAPSSRRLQPRKQRQTMHSATKAHVSRRRPRVWVPLPPRTGWKTLSGNQTFLQGH